MILKKRGNPTGHLWRMLMPGNYFIILKRIKAFIFLFYTILVQDNQTVRETYFFLEKILANKIKND